MRAISRVVGNVVNYRHKLISHFCNITTLRQISDPCAFALNPWDFDILPAQTPQGTLKVFLVNSSSNCTALHFPKC